MEKMGNNNHVTGTIDEHTNQIIDLTEFDFLNVNWPTGTIELDDSGRSLDSVTGPPRRRRRRRNNQDNRTCPESVNDSSIVVINDSPIVPSRNNRDNSPAPWRCDRNNVEQESQNSRTLPKNRRSLKTKNPENGEVTSQDPENNYRDRSPIFFGECPICLEPLGKNPLASTRCGHVFCLKCLQNALKSSKRCPNCRTLLRGTTGYHPLYLSNNKK